MNFFSRLIGPSRAPFIVYFLVLFLLSIQTNVPAGSQSLGEKKSTATETTEVVTGQESKDVEQEESTASENTSPSTSSPKSVLILDMKMPILPGTMGFLKSGIESAERDGHDLLVVRMSTPGGMLNTTQDMIQMIFESAVPIVIYVSPAGGSATSAGVFITMAAHVAAMAPGTSIGAAHPVSGEGKDIEGDMRLKVENMASAMVKSISDRRGRNGEWAVKAVKESSSVTVDEAIKLGVVDIKAQNLDELFEKLEGRTIDLKGSKETLSGFQGARIVEMPMSVRYTLLNFLSNPSVAAILWLVATTGIGVELYNPGLIFPGVAGAVCLVLALISMQVLPLSQGAILLLVVGVLLILAEAFITSGILGLGGILSIIVGLIYLVDTNQAPTLQLQFQFIAPIAALLFSMLGAVVWAVVASRRAPNLTGYGSLVGQDGVALGDFDGEGKAMIDGEIWNVVTTGMVKKDQSVRVLGRGDGLVLQVEPLSEGSE